MRKSFNIHMSLGAVVKELALLGVSRFGAIFSLPFPNCESLGCLSAKETDKIKTKVKKVCMFTNLVEGHVKI